MNTQATLAQAKQLKDSGNVDAAAQQFAAVLQLQPDQPEANFHLAAILAGQGRVREATPYMERAAASAGDVPEVLAGLAELYAAERRYDDAADQFQRIIKTAPQGPTTVQALLHHGVMRAKAGRLGDAAEDFKWVTQISPDYAPGWHNLGNTMLKLKNRAGAVDAYRKALELEPDTPHAVYALGRALIWTKDYDEAIATLTRALDLAPGRPQILSYKIAALRLAGRPNEADALEGLDDTIVSINVAPPSGSASVEEWNRILHSEINNHSALESAQAAGAEATGAKAVNDIFAENKTAVFQTFQEQMETAFEVAIGMLPEKPDHPVLRAKPQGYRLAGSAGTMTGATDQPPHNRPGAWLSGIYCCAVPAGLGGGGDPHAGWLEFGGTPGDMPPCPDAPHRQVEVKEGTLIVAPSYILRRRLPFTATAPLVLCSVDIPALSAGPVR